MCQSIEGMPKHGRGDVRKAGEVSTEGAWAWCKGEIMGLYVGKDLPCIIIIKKVTLCAMWSCSREPHLDRKTREKAVVMIQPRDAGSSDLRM